MFYLVPFSIGLTKNVIFFVLKNFFNILGKDNEVMLMNCMI